MHRMLSNAATSIDLTPLHPLRFARLRFDLEAAEDLHLPEYKGSTFRGGFGNALKKALCMTKTFDCPPCLLKHTCHYISIFEPKVNKNVADLLRVGRDVPLPFVLEPPLTEQRQFKKGEQFSAGLVLVGRAIELLPSAIYAFTVFGERVGLGMARGKFVLRRVMDRNGTVVFDGRNFKNDPAVASFQDFSHNGADRDNVRLEFLTPTRIMTSYGNGRRHLMRLRNTDDFWTFVETLYHRLFALTNLYCTTAIRAYAAHRLSLNSRRLALTQLDIRWVDWKRLSFRQKTTMTLGGFVGSASVEGDIAELLPLLRIGAELHVGKNTSFGLGKYSVA